MDGRVVVVGAGPVGCTAALALALRGIPVLLLDREASLPDDLRASTVHPSSLDLLDTIGVTERIIPIGLDAPVYQYRDRISGEYVNFDLGVLRDDTRFPMRLQCEQFKITRVIVAMLADLPNAEVRFGVEVTDVVAGANGVTLTVRDRSGRIDLVHGAFAVACDGASSTVRKRLGIEFEGFTYPEKFLSIGSPLDYTAYLPGLANVSYISDPVEWCALVHAVDRAVEYVQASSMRNKKLLEERDPAVRRERFDELRAIAEDPVRARDYLRRSTLYESLERANAVA
jgi:3-(3-hydroxy-phenyl)propionate hydroxylase